MATIYNLDTANLFAGDDDPDHSQFLVLNSVKFPALEEATKEFKPGGGIAGVKIGMRSIGALMISFNLAGLNLKVMNKFMTNRREHYTIRGNVANVTTQEDIPLVCVVHGRMTKVDMGEFKKDDGINTDYEINEITRYMLKIGGDEKYFIDVFGGPNAVRIDGRTIFRQVARNIGLGT
jgi:P2 family phage contractile tail tube protein